MSKLVKSTLIYTLGEFLPRLFSIVFLPVFTTYLSSTDYGIMSYTGSFMVLLYVFIALSLNSFLLRKYYECKTEQERKSLIGNVAFVITVSNILVLALAFLLGPFICEIANIKVAFYPYFSLSLINNFIDVFAIVPLVVFRIMEKPTQYVLLNIGRNVLPYLITYFLLAHLQMGILGFYYGRLFINLLFIIPILYITYKNSTFTISKKLIREGLKFSIPLIPGSIAYFVMSISDRIIMERYISLSLIGIYSIAYTLAFSLNIFISSGYRAFEPEIFKKFGQDGFSAFIEGLHKIFMFIIFSMAIALSLFSKEILQILTNGDFENGYTVVPILIIGVVLSAENTILGSLAIAEKKTKLTMYSTLLGAVFSFLLNIVLIPHIGYYGAALATIVSFLTMNIIIFKGLEYKLNSIKYDFAAYITFVILSIISTFLISQLSWGFGYISSLKLLILLLAIGVLSYFYKIQFSKIRTILISPLLNYLPIGKLK
jgi:O-antigen/teichoic acid export membrane protein